MDVVIWCAAMAFLRAIAAAGHGLDHRRFNGTRVRRKTGAVEAPPTVPKGSFTFASRALPDGVVGGRQRAEAAEDVVQLVLAQTWDKARLEGGTSWRPALRRCPHSQLVFSISFPAC